jgi:hypothetical protein
VTGAYDPVPDLAVIVHARMTAPGLWLHGGDAGDGAHAMRRLLEQTGLGGAATAAGVAEALREAIAVHCELERRRRCRGKAAARG